MRNLFWVFVPISVGAPTATQKKSRGKQKTLLGRRWVWAERKTNEEESSLLKMGGGREGGEWKQKAREGGGRGGKKVMVPFSVGRGEEGGKMGPTPSHPPAVPAQKSRWRTHKEECGWGAQNGFRPCFTFRSYSVPCFGFFSSNVAVLTDSAPPQNGHGGGSVSKIEWSTHSCPLFGRGGKQDESGETQGHGQRERERVDEERECFLVQSLRILSGNWERISPKICG